MPEGLSAPITLPPGMEQNCVMAQTCNSTTWELEAGGLITGSRRFSAIILGYRVSAKPN